ncbi:unnamed protein product [Cuscuta campestris]|uniref:Uncharacterized protein n=1 Tax=Cuscuta campestris TaxID=132261 RepID=A0A484N577_9ASTE|nr:unnamed protein product [Cuscuta campestris]
MTDEQKKKKVRGAGKCEKLYKRRRDGHPPIDLEWERGEPALSEKNRDIQKKNTYPHYMVWGGYAMLLRELAASQATTSVDITGSSTETGSQLGREDSWLRGHTPGRQAEVTDPALMEIRDRIVQLKKEVVDGTFVPDGHNDILTRALGTAEHSGQTRGVGSYSGLRKVFKGNMKPRMPEGNNMTEEDLLQRPPTLLQQYGLSVSGGAPDFASMSQHTPPIAPHYGQRSSKASADFVDFTDLTDVAACYLRISDPADYIVAHGLVFPRAPGDMPPVHTARHGDFSSRKSRPILGVRPTAPSSPVHDVVDQSSYVSFEPRCRELCQWLTRTSALPTISVILDPESMLYPEETELRMRPENIREFMRWEEVDQTIIIVFLGLGGYFGNGTCLSLRLDRIGLMFPEYPNK